MMHKYDKELNYNANFCIHLFEMDTHIVYLNLDAFDLEGRKLVFGDNNNAWFEIILNIILVNT